MTILRIGRWLVVCAVALAPLAGAAQETGAPAGHRWDGPFVGGSLAYAGHGNDKVGLWDQTSDAWLGTLGKLETRGGLVRLQAGERWTLSNQYVVGAQVALAFGNVDDTTGGLRHDLKQAVFLRGTAGQVLAPAWLGYVSAGLGYGEFKMTNGAAPFAKVDYNKLGYTLGAGIERALTDRLSVFGEYEYAQFGKKTVRDGGVQTEATPKWQAVSLGLNYRF